MNAQSRRQLLAIGATITIVGCASIASSETCSNSCVTMAIPSSPEGVQTKLDGTADAALWPPGPDLRPIRISALNDRGSACDVTISDVRQDESPGMSGTGTPIDDAVNCSNDGKESSVELRGNRADDGNGRSYHIRFMLDDPDCGITALADEVLVVVPRDEKTTSLKSSAEDEGTLTASYSGSTLECTPRNDDRLVSN